MPPLKCGVINLDCPDCLFGLVSFCFQITVPLVLHIIYLVMFSLAACLKSMLIKLDHFPKDSLTRSLYVGRGPLPGRK